jgi:hypothetical protein
LVAVWLFATLEGVGSARELARLCQEHLAYQWLLGGVSINYHTLADFRVGCEAELDQLLTHSVAALTQEGLVDLEQTAQDGVRIRASAGASSFRRQETLEGCLQKAEQQVQALKQAQEKADSQGLSQRQQAARERHARERVNRIKHALQVPRKSKPRKPRTGSRNGRTNRRGLRPRIQKRE